MTAGGALSAAEVRRYHEQGYVVPADFRIPAAMLDDMREALDRLMADNPDVGADAMFCPHIIAGGAQGLRGENCWLEWARHAPILDMVEQLIGGDFLLWGTTVFGKPAYSGKEVPWHQDGEYWPIRPLATCSVWIALDAATPENGCLRVIPGSHRGREVRRHRQDDSDSLALNAVLEPETFDAGAAADIVLEPGQVSLHDVYLVHGSQPNRSAHRRAGYVLRMMPTSSHFDHRLGAEINRRKGGGVDFSNRPLYLLRGSDRCGRNDFRIGKDGPAESVLT